ncbi:MAG: DNA double-strand break repair nuclease NurA [Thermoproteota archaeon]|jgi:hypothetical protein|nr:DNA double-strand break repair nuclease NurA [Thermoproteota archaeon]
MTFEIEEVTWYQLPLDLQAQFYERAEKDSDSILKRAIEIYERLKSLPEELKSCINKFEFLEKDLAIAAVDGSRSMSISNRLGMKVAVLSAGTLILKNNKREEKFKTYSIKEKQKFSDATVSYRLSLILSYLERKIAKEILNDVDYVLIDGSFYGFIYPLLRLKKEGLLSDKMKELLGNVFDLTNELIDSKKVLAIVKRTRTKVIGAWIFLKNNDPRYVEMLDRMILTHLMPKQSIFDYRDLIKNGIGNSIQIYNEVASLISKGEIKDNILEHAREKAYEPFESLGLNIDHFEKLSRIHVKAYSDVATCEIEHPNLSIEELLKVVSMKDFFNPATGLPLILDMIDNLVSLPLKFTEDYVKEIEARTISKAMKDQLPLEVVKILFFNMNPQKIY